MMKRGELVSRGPASGGFLGSRTGRRHRQLRRRHPDFELWWLRGSGEEAQELRKRVLHDAALDDHVEHAVLQEGLGPLKARRQRLADRLLDDPGPGKADESFWLGQVEVAEHGEARRHTPPP